MDAVLRLHFDGDVDILVELIKIHPETPPRRCANLRQERCPSGLHWMIAHFLAPQIAARVADFAGRTSPGNLCRPYPHQFPDQSAHLY
jgi:hypothetical protein